MGAIVIRPLDASAATVAALADILIETVAAGGSVTFLHPLARDDAEAYWREALESAAQGERVVLGAFDGEALVGTLSLLLDTPANQRHRAEIAKMMTRRDWRGRGVGTMLLREAERVAVAKRRTLLTLDTAADEGASGFYEKLGYTFAGAIPDYAFRPHGALTATRLYWKRIAGG
jgi:ribosomal protein S18 acetylase RimI-like enzyme